ncbi:selenoprotein H [Bactrocera oleae]|uniref:selenoprotein H n=1 Tax=Bactrocera oleae TaxID=104688 RepID=UPI0006B7B891|nr:selenoprotein H [Bactrocera oleae]
MAPRGKKSKKQREIDWAADANFDKNRSMIYIEHTLECPIFTTKAEEFAAYVAKEAPNRIIQLVRNHNGKVPPREGAFEIGFSQNARTSVHQLWSGIEKGPPRRDKFPPEYESLMQEIHKILKKFYPDAVEKNPLEGMEEDGAAPAYE